MNLESRRDLKLTLKWTRETGAIAIAGLSVVLIVFGVISPILSIAALALNVAYILMATPEYIFYQLFCLIPFAYIFKYSRSSSSFFTYLMLLMVLVIVFRKQKIDRNFLIAFFLFAAYIVIGGDMRMTMILKQVAIPLVVYCFLITREISFKKTVCYLSFGLILSGLTATFRGSIPQLTAYIGSGVRAFELEGDVHRFTGLYPDPNYFGTLLSLSIASLMILYIRKQIGAVSWIMIVPMLIFGSMTVSKSFLIMICFIAVYCFILMIKNKRYVVAFIFFALCLGVVLGVALGKVELFSNVWERLLASAESGDLTTNRSNIWGKYLSYFGENKRILFFGNGVGSDLLDLGVGIAAHNTYIDCIYYYGLVGTVLFVISIAFASKPGGRPRRHTIDNYFLVICFLFLIFFLSYVITFDFPFLIGLIIFSYKQNFILEPKK